MNVRRRHLRSLPPAPAHPRREGSADRDESRKSVDWPAWLRLIERKRRLYRRHHPGVATVPPAMLDRLTYVSFRLDGISLQETDILASRETGHRDFRSRLAQRLRNHVAILHRIENSLRVGESLKTAAVLRWYTSISAGLSTTMPADGQMERLDQVVRRINSPHLRLQPALHEIARVHLDAMNDELVPGFNGILARLLLIYHLGRCGLPPVLFDPEHDHLRLKSESFVLSRLLEMIDEMYDRLLAVA